MQTTLDLALQRAAEAAVREGVSRIEKARPQLTGRVQAAVIALEPASGEIRALVGGRSYVESSYNRATRAARQPGSIFKPFVYLAAFEAAGAVSRRPPCCRTSRCPFGPRARAGSPRTWTGSSTGP